MIYENEDRMIKFSLSTDDKVQLSESFYKLMMSKVYKRDILSQESIHNQLLSMQSHVNYNIFKQQSENDNQKKIEENVLKIDEVEAEREKYRVQKSIMIQPWTFECQNKSKQAFQVFLSVSLLCI
ncbi:Hypothetical_protein [Hexamita inflata]|uniref:Hypothetical_protein n=1 Tax=Hexamita inflata TaxID=28002 RepID=A0AA86Q4A9_9EUKA|nr:Hypothetical protein HINF_LOCUS33685 [Hexamita inflata]CAI9967880.1 Hypothetical protein HINF_LOCUS55525 [Hexamita inflata]